MINLDALKNGSLILTDDDYFLFQDKANGFKYKVTKAELAAAIGGGGGGGGWVLIEDQDESGHIVGTNPEPLDISQRGGHLFTGLELLPYRRYRIIFKAITETNNQLFHRDGFDVAYDGDATLAVLSDGWDWQAIPRGIVDNEGVVTSGTSTGGMLTGQSGTATDPMWQSYIDMEFEPQWEASYPLIKKLHGTYNSHIFDWKEVDQSCSMGSFQAQINPSDVLAEQKLRNLWFLPGLARCSDQLFTLTGTTMDFYKCSLYGME